MTDPGLFFHFKRDPLQCVDGREQHEFEGWRAFADGNGGEQVCKHCGIGAMAVTMAVDDWTTAGKAE